MAITLQTMHPLMFVQTVVAAATAREREGKRGKERLRNVQMHPHEDTRRRVRERGGADLGHT